MPKASMVKALMICSGNGRVEMRLIDADELIIHLVDYGLQEATFFPEENQKAYDTIANCIEMVEKQPTAYDLQTVVRQLEDVKCCELEKVSDCDENGCGDAEQIYSDGRSQGRYEAFMQAIKIVKDGVRNE